MLRTSFMDYYKFQYINNFANVKGKVQYKRKSPFLKMPLVNTNTFLQTSNNSVVMKEIRYHGTLCVCSMLPFHPISFKYALKKSVILLNYYLCFGKNVLSK